MIVLTDTPASSAFLELVYDEMLAQKAEDAALAAGELRQSEKPASRSRPKKRCT